MPLYLIRNVDNSGTPDYVPITRSFSISNCRSVSTLDRNQLKQVLHTIYYLSYYYYVKFIVKTNSYVLRSIINLTHIRRKVLNYL
jgi:hypothetical protein